MNQTRSVWLCWCIASLALVVIDHRWLHIEHRRLSMQRRIHLVSAPFLFFIRFIFLSHIICPILFLQFAVFLAFLCLLLYWWTNGRAAKVESFFALFYASNVCGIMLDLFFIVSYASLFLYVLNPFFVGIFKQIQTNCIQLIFFFWISKKVENWKMSCVRTFFVVALVSFVIRIETKHVAISCQQTHTSLCPSNSASRLCVSFHIWKCPNILWAQLFLRISVDSQK